MKTIVGAGLAGLIAAHAWPQARLHERGERPAQNHKALLRFRTDAVSRLTGIEFRKVRVRKGIWSRNQFVGPNIALANDYSRKCLGRLIGERSIWQLDPVDRFIAPDDFYAQLVESVGDRITWNSTYDWAASPEPVLSTAPLPVALKALNIAHKLDFARSPITVQRFLVSNADVHQTVYFPDLSTPVYRASITGSMLIVESVGEPDDGLPGCVVNAFALGLADTKPIESVHQSYGKIAPVDDAARKALLFKLTHEHGIYSLGRFATWRNLLLDDLVDDIAVIKKLLRASTYDLHQQMR